MRNEPAPLWPGDPAAAWEPYDPARDGPWTAARVAHLHRRAGFGEPPARLARDLKEGPAVAIRRAIEGEPTGPDGRTVADFEAVAAAMNASARRDPAITRVRLAWLFRLIHSPHPLGERLTLAWHNHYATAARKVGDPIAMLDQVEAIRAHWDAPVTQLHRAVLDSTAMQRWLDGIDSDRDRPNENLGREFLELYSLGDGAFTEADVKAAARALTGYRNGPRDDYNIQPGVVFDPKRHDSGAKTLLGQAGPWGPADLVRIAAGQPASARVVARRLFTTLVADVDPPPPDLVSSLADRIRTPGDVDIAGGVRIILGSRLFFDEAVRGRMVKAPIDFVVGLIRASGWFRPSPDSAALDIHLTRMGQILLDPPGVGGWPGGFAWLGAPFLVARANFVADITAGPAAEGRLGALAAKQGFATPEGWANAVASGFLPTGGKNAPTARTFAEALREITSTPLAHLA
jgi:uncharacterized protein (DUF1800 family)